MKIDKKYLFPALLGCLLMGLLLVACRDDESQQSSGTINRYKVAVIMPASQQSNWERAASWALSNIEKAQEGLSCKVKIEIEWKDENAADLDSYLESVSSNEEYAAVIGPYTSVHAQRAVEKIAGCKPLLLPVATSTNLQRICAGMKGVWFLTQSDIAQCEMLLSQARLAEADSVCLLTGDDTYGQSFVDWFEYQATEMGLNVSGITIYRNEQQLRKAIDAASHDPSYYRKAMLFAPGTEEEAIAFDDEAGKLIKASGRNYFVFPLLYCSDMMCSAALAHRLVHIRYEGLSPDADPSTGFISAYLAKFGTQPVAGEAHLYDAITMLAYALVQKECDSNSGAVTLNDALSTLLTSSTPCSASWLPVDMHNVFSQLRSGSTPHPGGVTGDWSFDEKTHNTILNTTYRHWSLYDGQYTTLEYLSTDGSRRTTSSTQAWEWTARQLQDFNSSQQDFIYPALKNCWAVVISTSDNWTNYRHQADALAMYQLLRRHGYDDEHIVLITQDNIATDIHNLHQGEVRVRPDGENLYTDVHNDYKLSDINVADLKEIMLGNRTDRLHEVISSTAADNITVFWCGHGGYGELAWGSYQTVNGDEVRDILAAMNEQNKYRKILFVIDACYSGSIGEACKGIPGALFITSARPGETSKADMKDVEMGVWLSNGFTRAFQEQIDETAHISLRNLYYVVAGRTVGSHATVYNSECYGNLYNNTMEEFLP